MDRAHGRFLSADPMSYLGGVNMYEFAGNNPISCADPLGLFSIGSAAYPWLAFDSDTVGGGLAVGSAAVATSFTFGLYDGGKYKCSPYFNTSIGLANFGRDSLLMAAAPEAEADATLGDADQVLGDSGNCFTVGSLVQMADGKTKPIQKVKAGDHVRSRKSVTGKTETKAVLRTYKHLAHTLITVRLANAQTHQVVQTLTAAPGHRFFVAHRGPVALGKLGIGTLIVTRAGPPLAIASLVKHERPQGVAVYNFEVQGDHTYFVGKADGGVWVHNDCTDIALNELDKAGQGAIIRVQPTNTPVLEEGDWSYHDVMLRTDGTVYDPMRPSANGLSFDDWVNTWQHAEDYDFSYVSPEDIESFRSDLKGLFGP